MPTAIDLDLESLPALVAHTDPVGVLSIYLDADPAEQSTRATTWEVALRRDLDALVARLKEEGPRERWIAVRDALAGLERELADLASPRGPGRGRVMFIGVGSGDVWQWASQVGVRPAVVFEDRPYVSPLITLFERGAPAGVVMAHRDGLRVVEIRFGEGKDVMSLDFSTDEEEWREMKGPAGANPAMAQQTAPQRDRFERRLDEHRGRFLVDAAARVADIARQRNWTVMVITGDPRHTAAVEAALPAEDTPELLRRDALLEPLPAADVVTAVEDAVEEASVARRAHLVTRAMGAAAAGGRGAVGTRDVVKALNEGRVATLLIADGARLAGYVAEDGLLAIRPDQVVGDHAGRDDRFGERMIERAVATAAVVVPVGASDELAPVDGVAAILRW
jgi:hypothetical protein